MDLGQGEDWQSTRACWAVERARVRYREVAMTRMVTMIWDSWVPWFPDELLYGDPGEGSLLTGEPKESHFVQKS